MLTAEQKARKSYLARMRYVPHPRVKDFDLVKKKKALAKAYVQKIRSDTFCEICGKQPIEWHSKDHEKPGKGYQRVGSLVAVGFSIERIKAEIDKCQALCRSCHMKLDGRLQRLQENCPQHGIKPPKPCSECGRLAKPLRKGLCSRCNDRKRRPSKGKK